MKRKPQRDYKQMISASIPGSVKSYIQALGGYNFSANVTILLKEAIDAREKLKEQNQ